MEDRVSVPVEPTEAMRAAGKRAVGWNPAPEIHAVNIYQAMLSARPVSLGGGDFSALQPQEAASVPICATADSAGQWRPIEEHDGSCEPVLLWFPDFAPVGSRIGFFRAAERDCYYLGQWLDDLNNEPFEVNLGEVFPTHWMPLPAAPDAPPATAQPGTEAEGGVNTKEQPR